MMQIDIDVKFAFSIYEYNINFLYNQMTTFTTQFLSWKIKLPSNITKLCVDYNFFTYNHLKLNREKFLKLDEQ